MITKLLECKCKSCFHNKNNYCKLLMIDLNKNGECQDKKIKQIESKDNETE